MQGHIIFKPSTETYTTTITNTTATLGAIPASVTRAIIQVETQDVRVTTDGSVPAQTRGLLLKAAAAGFPGMYVFEGYDSLSAMKLFRGAATDAVINVVFQRPE